MPAVTGVINFDRKPVDVILLEKMSRAYAFHSPEPPKICYEAYVGLGCHGTAEMRGMELRSGSSSNGSFSYQIAFDGRVDNRNEILECSQFSNFSHSCQSCTDAEVALIAYLLWGTQCAAHLLGDFSFAIWDRRTDSLVVVRDALGVRSLFYINNERQFTFASFISQLLEDPNVPQSIDEEYFSDYFVRGGCQNELTPFKVVRRLLPGWLIQVKGNSVSLLQYWKPDRTQKINFCTDPEFETRFRSLFRASVVDRLRSPGPVAAELSGGLDSSSIVCMAQEIYRSGELPANSFKTYTDTFDGFAFDERHLSRVVREKYQFCYEEVPLNDFGWFKDCDRNVPCWDEPNHGILIYSDLYERGRHLKRDRIEVLLSGIGGDQVFRGTCFPRHLSDSLKRLTVKKLFADLSAWQRTIGWSTPKLFLEACLKPLIWPNSLEDVGSSLGVPHWLTHGFVRRMGLGKRSLRYGFLPRYYSSPALQQHYQDIVQTNSTLIHGYMFGVQTEVRYPFLDRRLVEFALAIPPEQLIRPFGDSKSIVRRAMRGLVPDTILRRTNKMSFDQRFYACLQQEWHCICGMLDDLILDSMGYVCAPSLYRELSRARLGLPTHKFLLLNTLSAEAWLRARNSHPQGNG